MSFTLIISGKKLKCKLQAFIFILVIRSNGLETTPVYETIKMDEIFLGENKRV